MRAVARLVWVVFTATPLLRWFAGVGAAAFLAGLVGYLMIPAWSLGSGSRPEGLWLQALVEALPFIGLLLLTIGFSLRERNVGVLMMWIGTLGIFGIMCWKILAKLA